MWWCFQVFGGIALREVVETGWGDFAISVKLMMKSAKIVPPVVLEKRLYLRIPVAGAAGVRQDGDYVPAGCILLEASGALFFFRSLFMTRQ